MQPLNHPILNLGVFFLIEEHVPHLLVVPQLLFLAGQRLVELDGVDGIGGAVQFALDDRNGRKLQFGPVLLVDQLHHFLHLHQRLHEHLVVVHQRVLDQHRGSVGVARDVLEVEGEQSSAVGHDLQREVRQRGDYLAGFWFFERGIADDDALDLELLLFFREGDADESSRAVAEVEEGQLRVQVQHLPDEVGAVDEYFLHVVEVPPLSRRLPVPALVEGHSDESFIGQSLSQVRSGARMHAERVEEEDNALRLLRPVDLPEGGQPYGLLALATVQLHEVLLAVLLPDESDRLFLALGLALHKFDPFLAEGHVLSVLRSLHRFIIFGSILDHHKDTPPGYPTKDSATTCKLRIDGVK